MATFQAQVDGLTGLTIGTSPTTDEVAQFLNDGVTEITNRCILTNPRMRGAFTRVTSELTSNGQNLGSADIIDVVREAGVVNDWRPCREVPPGLQTRVTDIDSLNYASKYNPAYIKWNDSSIAVYPAPTTSPNRYKIFYINNVPTFSGGGTTVACDTIHYFPNDKVYLVILYASIQSLMNALSDYSITDLVLPVSPAMGTFSDVTQTIPTWTSPSLVVPTAPSDANIDFSSVPSAPVFVKPTFLVPTLASVAVLRLPPAPVVPPQFSVNTIDISTATAPVYAGPVVAPDFSQLVTYIETEEDSELASAQSSKIQLELSEFQNKMTDALNKFNEDNVLYQAQLQELTKTVDLQEASDNRELQRFQGEVSKYQAEVNSIIQKWQQEEWTQNFQKYTTDYSSLLQEHSADIQKEQNRVQNDLQVYQQEISKATGTYSAETGYDLSKYSAEVSATIQKFNGELQLETQRHQAELAQYTSDLSVISEKNNRLLQKFSSELQKYTAEMQVNLNAFNTELQDKQTTYKWMTERLMLLKNQYDTAFAIQQPKRQEGE